MVKKIPRTLMKSLLHFMLTGPSVLPAMGPNNMPSVHVLSKFKLDSKPFSNIWTISKALVMEYSSTKVRFPSSAYWLILDSSEEPGRRTPLISLQFLIAAPSLLQPGYTTGRKGGHLGRPHDLSQRKRSQNLNAGKQKKYW